MRLLLLFRCCLACMVFLQAKPLCAQSEPGQLYFHHLNASDGLSQAINAFIYKDKQGFVWISSLDGLNRFDGHSVRVYRPEEGNQRSLLGNNMQSPFFEDEQGNLWFGTDGAINCYHRQTDDFSNFQVVLDSVPFTGSYYIMHRSKNGRLWARLNDTLCIILPPPSPDAKPEVRKLGPFDGQRHFVVLNRQGEPEYVWSIKLGRSGQVFYYKVQGDSMTALPPMAPAEVPPPVRIAKGDNGTAWFCTYNGLWHINYRAGKVLGHYTKFEGNNIGACNDFVSFDQRTAFVSTEKGLLVFDKVQKKFTKHYTHVPDKPSSLASDEMVEELTIDRDAVLWVTIWTRGVDFAKIDKAKFKLLDKRHLLLPGETAFSTDALLLDDNEALWLGSNMAPLRVLHKGAKLPVVAIGPDGKPIQNIGKMVRLRSGNVLMMNNVSIVQYHVRDRRFSRLSISIENSKIHNAVAMNDGSAIISTDSSIYHLGFSEGSKPVVQKMRLTGNPTDTFSFSKVFKDSRERIYLSSQSDFVDVFTYQSSGALVWLRRLHVNDEFHALAETDSLLWISTRAMLARYPLRSLTPGVSDSAETVLNRTVYGLLPDNNHNLWFSTNSGLVRFDTRNKVFREYHLSDGLQGYEYNASAYQKTPDGRLWFGGVDGVNFFHPDSVRDIQTRAPLLLTGLKVNDEPFSSKTNISLLDTLELTYDQKTLSFDFVVADYSDPQNTQHWYQMTRLNGDSPDNDWIKGQNARGFARYANLDPGEYLFKIKGANADGVVNPDLRTVFIVIHPPFWQTWWFITLCLLAGAMATYAGIRYYIRENLRLKNLKIREQRLQIEKQDALTKERNRIAGEMHDDLGGGLTSIRMLSERLTAKTDNPDMKNAVDKIAGHAQSLVLRMSEIIWAMNSNFDTVDNLIAYIRRYCAEYLDEHHLRSVIHVPENVPDFTITGEKRRNVYLAVKESLHNIVKHARAERVNIDFETDTNQLVITVRDNGKGIDPDLINQFGNGLYNMKKRLEDIGGTMTLTNDEGTLITFTMPINTQAT